MSRHAILLRIPFIAMSFSVLDSARRSALDCYRSYVTLLVTCHPHRHRYSPPRLSVSFSLSLYVRLCQTDRLNIRFSLRSPPYFIRRLSCPTLASSRPPFASYSPSAAGHAPGASRPHCRLPSPTVRPPTMVHRPAPEGFHA